MKVDQSEGNDGQLSWIDRLAIDSWMLGKRLWILVILAVTIGIFVISF
jgi:hypothetical protein